MRRQWFNPQSDDAISTKKITNITKTLGLIVTISLIVLSIIRITQNDVAQMTSTRKTEVTQSTDRAGNLPASLKRIIEEEGIIEQLDSPKVENVSRNNRYNDENGECGLDGQTILNTETLTRQSSDEVDELVIDLNDFR